MLLFSDFELDKILKGETEWIFLIEIAIRTVIMFVAILIALAILGKRGVKQLSVFELVIIISLGSAAGDPMFYKEVGILSAFTVFIMIILCYKLTTYLVFKSDRIEKMIEGTPICLIKDGKFSITNFKNEPIGYDEFFGEMRQYSVSHLGQIELAYIEISGEISLYYYKDEDVKYGLPILPHLYEEQHVQIMKTDNYSCAFCGTTEVIEQTDKHLCGSCGKEKWVKSLNTTRIT
ncbi:DUF421 domain-containing protein [Flavobacterium sp. PLA-1-15]|uniref:DUF421 domain-containing protein n=1 Tax=Flavobacterium sp. PLA-1-15 TaxID=3380533 RepID=UPI003B80DF4D